MAVESTPERSLSDLLSNSLAAEATTGCGPCLPRCGVVIIATSVVSIGRRGSDRSEATPASVLLVLEPDEDDAVRVEQPGGLHLLGIRPARRAVGLGVPRLARAPDRHADGGEAAGRSDQGTLYEDARRVSVEEVPPPEEGRRRIDRQAGEIDRCAKLRLEVKTPSKDNRRAVASLLNGASQDGTGKRKNTCPPRNASALRSAPSARNPPPAATPCRRAQPAL
jgi:hypothetical protein